MLSLKIKSALEIICKALPVGEVNWAVAGRASLALQGINVDTTEINILATKNSAYEIERRLKQYAMKHVQFTEDTKSCSHFGMLLINGMPSEIIGEYRLRSVAGEWDSPMEVLSHRRFIEYEGMQIPVTTFDYELKALRAARDEEAADIVGELVGKQ
jgi:hypothetical protein